MPTDLAAPPPCVVAAGSQGSFSLEDAEGLHFVTRSRLWTDAESRILPTLR